MRVVSDCRVSGCAILAIVGLLACGGRVQSSAAAGGSRLPPEPPSNALDAQPAAYPQGAWRHQAPRVLNDYYVSLAHILVTHRDSQVNVLAGYWPWRDVWAPSTRTREEARTRAQRFARILRADPSRFAALARENSEDEITRRYGGNYGVLRSPNVLPELLDAYEALAEGEVSVPIESSVGYHIVERLPVPEETLLWARRILIMYTPVRGWVREGKMVTRSRAEARALAETVRARLRANPEQFGALIDAYSDDVNADVGGETGPFSNLAGTLDVDARLSLSQLRPMEISEVLDELSGFSIIQRLPERAREVRAFDAFNVAFDGVVRRDGSAATARNEADAKELASRIAATLAQHPEQFETYAAQFCADPAACGGGAAITSDGSTYPRLYRRLGALAVGAVSAQPEPTPFGMLVYRRAALLPARSAPARVFRLTAPE